MTRQPPIPPPLLKPRDGLDRTTEQRAYRLITPLYGGGVTPGERDPVTVVRATEVRGQLRFWWRATRGGQFGGELAAMKAAEDALWGAASTGDKARPSLVQVEVIPDPNTQPTSTKFASDGKPLNDQGSAWSYVAFPLRENREAREKREARENREAAVFDNVVFTLRLEYPRVWPKPLAALFPAGTSPEQELQAALWAWETFGGLGARTRRGFGALMRTDLPQNSASGGARQMLAAIQSRLETDVSAGPWPPGVPHLTRETRVATLPKTNASSQTVWEQLFGRLRDFRQARPYRMGRSTWPEPDSIRHLVLRRAPHIVKFPRAAFGLPIVFWFKSSKRPGALREPDTTILQTTEHDRMASPLIMRPVPCGGKEFLGIAVVLEGPRLPPGRLVLRHKDGRMVEVPSTDLDPAEAADIRLQDRPVIAGATRPDGTVDVLAAFLNYLERT